MGIRRTRKKIKNLDQLIGNIKYDDLKSEEKLIIINIVSKDEKIYFPNVCNTTIFS